MILGLSGQFCDRSFHLLLPPYQHDKSGSVEVARLKKVISYFELQLDVDGFVSCCYGRGRPLLTAEASWLAILSE